MATGQAGERTMISERVAPGMLPRVLNSFDMTIIFVAIVLFIVNASAIQQAQQAAFTYWILGFLAFLIPGAVITAQLGLMFPQEGSLYVWTQKALGPFWGFFAGFCAWWPGVLVMVATGDAVVTIWQFIDKDGLTGNWEQGLVILAVLWFAAAMSMLRLRMTQSYANVAVVFYGAAIFVIGLAGILWLIGDGHSATGGWGDASNWSLDSGNWTWFGFVILALLGIEVPLNMGVEIVKMRSIKRYLLLLFADIFLVRRAFPTKFEEVRVAHPWLLYACGIVGMLASAFGAYTVFRSPWTGLFTTDHWRMWLGVLCGVSVVAAVLIYSISEFTNRRETRHPTPSPA
jgi:hypothetical protein